MATRQDVMIRASRDDAFREEFKRDPRAIIKHELGISLPEDVEISVLEESPKHTYFVLPPRRAELSEEELASLAAGKAEPAAAPAAPALKGAGWYGWYGSAGTAGAAD